MMNEWLDGEYGGEGELGREDGRELELGG